MTIMDLIGIIKDYFKSINRPMMRLNDFNEFDDLDDLNDYFNDLNRH